MFGKQIRHVVAELEFDDLKVSRQLVKKSAPESVQDLCNSPRGRRPLHTAVSIHASRVDRVVHRWRPSHRGGLRLVLLHPRVAQHLSLLPKVRFKQLWISIVAFTEHPRSVAADDAERESELIEDGIDKLKAWVFNDCQGSCS